MVNNGVFLIASTYVLFGFVLQESGMSKVELKKSLEKIESAINDACEVLKQLSLPGGCNDDGSRAVATNS